MQHPPLTPNRTGFLTALLRLRPRLDGTPPADKKDDTPPSDKREMTKEQWEAQRRAELDKENVKDLTNRVIKLEADAHAMRHKLAPEGGLILSADERKRWEAFEKLGKPEDVSKTLDQAKKDREVVEKGEKRSHLSSVAEAAGWDADAFIDLDAMAGGLEWKVQEIKDKEGEKIQQVTVKDGDTWKDAAEFAEGRWKRFLPALQVSAEEKDDKPDDKPDAPVRVPVGGSGGGKGKTYTVADAEKAKAESGQYSM